MAPKPPSDRERLFDELLNGGGGSSSSTSTPSTDDFLKDLGTAKKRVRSGATKAARSAGRDVGGREADSDIDIFRVLGLPQAAIATALTPADTLVGERGKPETIRRAGDIPIGERLLGRDQLSLADPLKAAIFDTDEQRAYLQGREDTGTNVAMKITEGAGLTLDILTDPLNFLIPGGVGAYDDALRLVDDGKKIVGPAERLAAKAGENTFAARGLDEITRFNAAIDDIDAAVAAGLDITEATARKAGAVTAFRDAYGRLNGEALMAGDNVLQNARWDRAALIHEAPTARKGRAGWATERVNQIAEDIARFTGDSNPMVAGSQKLPAFGGMTGPEVVQKVDVRGFVGLPTQVREALGVTGRLWRTNPADFRSGRAFNPFARTASSTLAPRPQATEGPFSVLRRAALGQMPTEGAASKIPEVILGTAGSVLHPGMGRSGQLWKAAIGNTIDDPKVKKAALDRFVKVIGKPLAKAEDAEQLALYPLTLLNEARIDGIVRAGGKALRTSASRAQIELSNAIQNQMVEDPNSWVIAGIADDVVPRVAWTVRRQKALEVADNMQWGKGEIRAELGEALARAMGAGRADLPDDLSELAPGGIPSEIALKAGRHVINDPEFGADITAIALRHADALAHAGTVAKMEFGEADLARAALNALTNLSAVSAETDGLLSWTRTLSQPSVVRKLFTPQGAEEIGREAKLLSHMERLGIATVQSLDGQTYSTQELHDTFRSMATDLADDARAAGRSVEDWLAAKADLTRGLRERGVAEAEIASIENRLAEGVMTVDSLRGILDDATRAADAASGVATDADEARRLAAQALRDVEAAALKLEETHLALLDYRSLNEEGVRLAQEAEEAGRAVGMATVATGPLRERLHQLLDADDDWLRTITAAGPRQGPGGAGSRARILLGLARGEDTEATGAGVILQRFNRFLGEARDIFGDSIGLEQLDEHSAATYLKTRGFGQTEGAVNRATIAAFFQERMPPAITQIADIHGGWLQVLSDGNPEVLDQIENAGKALQRKNPALTAIGVSRRDFGEFMLGTLGQSIDAIRPFVDDVLDYMETGRGAERLVRIFNGENGVDTLRGFLEGDLTFIDNILSNALRSIDIAVGTSGGFADPLKFQMLREIVQSDPLIRDAFDGLLRTLDTLDSSSVYLREVADARRSHQEVLDELGAIIGATPNPRPLEARRDDLVGRIVSSDPLPELGERAALTAEEAAEARRLLADARAEVRRTRARLETASRGVPRLRDAHFKAMKDLELREASLDQMEAAVEAGESAMLRSAIDLDRQLDVVDGTPVLASVLGGSADFRAIKGGFAEFASDPRVHSYTNASGDLVRRSPERIAEMWAKRLEGAARWVEILRDRAVNGHTTPSGKVIPPITRYDVASAEAKKWADEAAFDGFGNTWRGAALADEGAARAMTQIATTYSGVEPGQMLRAYDMVLEMLKSGYVGTAGFSTRNLTGGIIENIRRNVSLRTSKKVWAVDSMLNRIEGIASYAASLSDGAEKTRLLGLVDDAQAHVETVYGKDLVAAVMEGRTSGLSESTLFGEIAGGGAAQGERMGWIRSIKDAARVGKLSNEARFGASPIGNLGAITGAISEIPRHPAAWYERKLAGGVERLARGGEWGKVFKGEDAALWRAAGDAAEEFTVHPRVEALLRTDLYAQRRLAGDTADRAFDAVMESHFDYSDLGTVDRALRRVFPFWTWRSRSLQHYSEMLLHHPQMAKTTFSVWNEDRRGSDPRAPISFQQPGTGLDPNSGLGLAVPDPGLDLLGLFQQVDDRGPLGPLREMIGSEVLPTMRLPFEINSGYTAEGVPIDTPTSIQGPMNAIAASGSGGEAFIRSFAYRKKGKWYWKWPGAMRAFDQAMPLLNNISKVTTPASDGDGLRQKTVATLAQFFGSPVRLVPEAQQERARIAAATAARYDRIEEAERRRRG